jgi:hypothetical protein
MGGERRKKLPLENEIEDDMPEVSITQQIFLNFFKRLKDKYHIDDEIINRLKKLLEENKLSDSKELDKLIEWLEEYNNDDKAFKS